jgi:hypothetical protein
MIAMVFFNGLNQAHARPCAVVFRTISAITFKYRTFGEFLPLIHQEVLSKGKGKSKKEN